MKKFTFFTIIFISFLFSSDLRAQVQGERIGVEWPPGTVFVDDDYDASTPGWGYDHFKSVLSGIERVREHGTVYVFSGDYEESASIAIDKPLYLMGEDRVSTILGSTGEDVVEITADSVTVSGFTIQHDLLGVSTSCVLINSDYCAITGNIVTRSPAGYGKGIVIWYGTHNLIQGNVVSNSFWGVQTCSYTYDNRILDNLIIGNQIGAWICCSPGPDLFYHNNFIGNYDHARVEWDIISNTAWDNGYPEGGNYWHDYDGIDEFSGPDQDIPGSDGIGDTPRAIPENDTQDNYPLMNPWIGLE